MPLMPHSSVFACPCLVFAVRTSIYSIRWLKCHSRLIYETFLSSRRHQSKLLSTTVLARSTRKVSSHLAIVIILHGKSVESSIEVYMQSEFEQLNSLHCYNVVEEFSVVKTKWPATVLVFYIETTSFSHCDDRIIEFSVP